MRPHLPDRTCHPGPFCNLSTSAATPTRTSTDTLQGTPQRSNSKADSLRHHLSGQSHKVERRPYCTRNHSPHTSNSIKSCLRIQWNFQHLLEYYWIVLHFKATVSCGSVDPCYCSMVSWKVRAIFGGVGLAFVQKVVCCWLPCGCGCRSRGSWGCLVGGRRCGCHHARAEGQNLSVPKWLLW